MSKKPIDRNLLCTRDVEFRAAERADDAPADDGRNMEGYAAVFGVPTDINSWEGRFTEQIAPGAFRKTLNERKPVLQFDHGRDSRVGSTPIGSFTTLREDEQGLYCEARLFDNPIVEPVRQAIEAQAISGMSFKFAVKRDEWRDNAGKLVKPDELGRLIYEAGDRGPLARTIKEVQLFEAGPVVFPAYAETSVGVRSLADMTDEDRAALIAEYARTALVEDEFTPEERAAETARAEAARAAAVERGELVAESLQKLAAEDAAREGTSEAVIPEDAARPGTSSGTEEKSANPPAATPVAAEPMTPRKVEPKVKTLAELRARLDEIATRMTALDAETRDAQMDEAQEKEWDALNTERAAADAAIVKIEERAKVVASLASRPAHVERGVDRTAPNFNRSADNIYDIGEIRSAANGEEDFASRLRDNAMRAVDKARFSSVANKSAAQENVEHLLDNVDNGKGDLAARMLLTGNPSYERAFGKLVKGIPFAGLSSDEQNAVARAQSLGSDAGGGYAVPFQLDPSVILTNNGVINPIRQLARIEQIVGKEWQGVTSAGVTVSRGTEASTVADGSFTLAQPVVRANRVQGFVPFSIEIDQDWNALRSEISRLLIDARETEEATSFVTGDGTGVNANGVVATLSGNTVTTATALTYAAADVYSMENALAPRFRANAQWLANKAFYNATRQFDTAGGAQLWERIGAGVPSELLGYRAHESSAMSSLVTTAGAKIALLGDFSQFLIVDRVGMSVELVPQIFDTSTGRPTGQRGIYAMWRNNSKVLVSSAFKLMVVHA